MRTIKRLLVLVSLLILLAAGALAYYANQPLILPAQPLTFSLPQGSSLKAAARQMKQAGILQRDWMFVWLARLLGKTTQIKAGNYELGSSVTPLQLLEMVSKGQVALEQLVVIEGWTFNQFRDALNADPDIRHDTAAWNEAEILQRLGASEGHAEGLFFPDTYFFASGASDLDLLQRSYQAMQSRLQEIWRTRSSGLPLESPYQALILASIVEKETGMASERNMIAGVFINRLRRGMMLQTDPAVIYGMGEQFDGNLRKRDLLIDTPYNTYTRPGLPPTPIALPGLAALQAALHPAQTDALYFVARGDGSSEFSRSLDQHNRAVNRYQK
jgi:UPF0755 protein